MAKRHLEYGGDFETGEFHFGLGGKVLLSVQLEEFRRDSEHFDARALPSMTEAIAAIYQSGFDDGCETVIDYAESRKFNVK